MQSSTDAPPAPLLSRVGGFLDRWVTPLIVRRLAVVTAVTMFIVYALGTLVTTTGSGHGCGDSWPLCRGQFVPEFAISTAIEFTHRVATAAVTVLVLATAFGVLWLWRSRLELRILAPLMVVALFAEAGLGAALVLLPASPVLLAIHFGASLVLFGSVLLTAIIVNELGGWDRLRDHVVAPGFRILVFALALYTYVVGYLGAYMRLRGAELSCRGWPACNGQIIPTFSGYVGIAFTHRVAAFVLLAGTVWAVRLGAFAARGPARPLSRQLLGAGGGDRAGVRGWPGRADPGGALQPAYPCRAGGAALWRADLRLPANAAPSVGGAFHIRGCHGAWRASGGPTGLTSPPALTP